MLFGLSGEESASHAPLSRFVDLAETGPRPSPGNSPYEEEVALNPVQPEPFGWLASQPLRINFGA